MFDLDKWQEIFTSMRRHPMRTLLTAFGVFWGICMLVLLLGLGNGLENGVEYEFREDATNSLFINRGYTSMPYKGLPRGRRIQFENADFDYLKENVKGIEYFSARFYLRSDQIVRYKQNNFSFSVWGVHPDHLYLENYSITKGRYINEKDMEEGRKVVCIGEVVARELFGQEESVGKEIRIGSAVYTVIGEFYDIGGESEMRNLNIPITTAQRVNGGTRQVHRLMITTGDLPLDKVQVMENQIRQILSQRYQFDVRDRRAVWMFNLGAEYAKIHNLLWAIRAFIWFVGIGSIVAGIIGVSNIMLIVVKDRTKEIGIRKALGATPRSIVSMILQESVFLTAIAGYSGLAFATTLIALMGSLEVAYFRNPQVDIRIAALATLVLVIAGTLAGVMPAIQAARIHPVVAMKD